MLLLGTFVLFIATSATFSSSRQIANAVQSNGQGVFLPDKAAVDALLDLDWSLPTQVLSEFLVPPRVQAAMKECDTNSDGELDRDEWKVLSDKSLEAILERHALARGNDRRRKISREL